MASTRNTIESVMDHTEYSDLATSGEFSDQGDLYLTSCGVPTLVHDPPVTAGKEACSTDSQTH